MKVAITSTGTELTSPLDPRFGRAKYFLLVDTDTHAVTVQDNAVNLNAAQGAGIQAAEAVVRMGAEAVLTGNCGPKAFQVLEAAGIKVYLCDGGSVEEALQQFQAGTLQAASSANVGGHW